jgi:CHAD domain-containing protein
MAQPRIPHTSASGGAREFAVEQAQRQLKHLGLQIYRTIKSSNTQAVHDIRVAIRRFSQANALCQTYFRAAGMRRHRRRLKKIMNGAGDVRNCDVALKLVAKFRVPHAAHIRSKLESQRKESARLLIAELRKWTDRRMSFKGHAALDSTPAPGKEEAANELAQRTLGRGAKDFLKQGNEASSPAASPKDLHRFRIASKKFRYALELFQPLYESSLHPVVESIKGASTLLGDINDCVTVAGMVADYKGNNPLADRLKKRQDKKTEEFRKYWKSEFGDGERLRESIDRLKSPEPRAPKKPVASSRISSQQTNRKSAA